MAKIRPGDPAALAPVSRRLTPPGVFLLRMTIFLTLVGFLAAILFDQLQRSFLNNPGLNGLIVGALLLGIIYAYRQVFRLYPEIRWVNAFRISDPGLSISARPVLLAPMATMLRDRTGTISLSTAAMRSFMDSIGSRLDEARDTGGSEEAGRSWREDAGADQAGSDVAGEEEIVEFEKAAQGD